MLTKLRAMYKAKVGLPVQFNPGKDDDFAKANGNPGPVAAVITRVWSNGVCNLKVMPDHGATQDIGSVSNNPSPLEGERSWKNIEE